ncbi:hypothetical protein [Massilia consociata]|uniref:Uncharacterized protein n=1 Tax=Massilia consociata TaxID=760117 RepID=A0ABV6FJB2_9BURK
MNAARPVLGLLAGLAAAAAWADAPAPQASAPRVELRDKAIRDAVRATLAETKDAPLVGDTPTLEGAMYKKFAQEFKEAKVPDCLHSEGLKRQPTFFLSGILALPFVPIAKLRGKCI